MARATRVAVLASGSGSNLQAILDRVATGQLAVKPVVVISDVPEARALRRAQSAGIANQVIAPDDYATRSDWNAALATALSLADVDLVILAGFMRIVSPVLLQLFAGRVLNIHPSLLPRYRGLNTYERVLAAGDPFHGSSVHYVTEELDGGPVIAQVRVRIGDHESIASLAGRVQAAEHWLYPTVVSWFAAGRLAMRGDSAWLDERRLASPILFSESGEALPDSDPASFPDT